MYLPKQVKTSIKPPSQTKPQRATFSHFLLTNFPTYEDQTVSANHKKPPQNPRRTLNQPEELATKHRHQNSPPKSRSRRASSASSPGVVVRARRSPIVRRRKLNVRRRKRRRRRRRRRSRPKNAPPGSLKKWGRALRGCCDEKKLVCYGNSGVWREYYYKCFASLFTLKK